MTTFAKSSFSAATYATFRPTYPPQLYSTLLAYHNGPRRLLLDLGCGHGLISRSLAPHFTHVHGSDPSANMISQAKSLTPSDRFPNIVFAQGSAEDVLEKQEPGSVDMIVAGQAAHWFDMKRVWPAAARALRTGGTVAWWCYKDHVFVDYPAASQIFVDFIYGHSKDTLGPYWEPGRQIVRQNFRPIQPPNYLFDTIQRIEYEPATNGPASGQGQVLMSKRLTLAESMEYLRTWSSVHSWQEKNGNPKRRDQGGPGDIVDVMYDRMRLAQGDEWDNNDLEVEIEWGSAIVMARSK